MTNPPDEVTRTLHELTAEIGRLTAGRWDLTDNAAGARVLRSQGESVVLAAKKVKEAVTQTTHPNR